MMRTCKSLHAMGLKPLLRSGVTVRSMKQLTEFCQFILDDLPLRARCLRKLSISMSLTDYIAHVDEQLLDAVEHRVGSLDLQKTPSEGLPLLVQILTHTTEVADLNIDSAEQLLQRHDGLVSGFAGLPRLRRLRMSSAGPKVLAMMRTIKANLREVHLDCFHQYSTSRTAVDVIPFSQSHHRTLEKLTVSYCNIRAPTENTVFLCMRELILRFTYGLDAALLSRCFPDLRHLELWHVRARHGNTPVHIRTANYGKCCERSWLALDHLSGDLNALFALAFTRRVKLLDIRFPPQAAILTMPRLHTLLSETSPSHLRLYLGYNRNGFSPTEIAQLLATPSALRITHLLLDIRLGNWTGTADALQVCHCGNSKLHVLIVLFRTASCLCCLLCLSSSLLFAWANCLSHRELRNPRHLSQCMILTTMQDWSIPSLSITTCSRYVCRSVQRIPGTSRFTCQARRHSTGRWCGSWETSRWGGLMR